MHFNIVRNAERTPVRIRPGGPGYQPVLIHPQQGYLKEAEGDVITPVGMVHVHWTKDENHKLELAYDAPKDLTVVVKES